LNEDDPLRLYRLAFLGALLAGCFSPNFDSGNLHCAANDSCPPGFHCASDQTCWKNGKDPATGGNGTDMSNGADMGTPPISSTPAASVWTSCGGGSGTGTQTQAQLNMSIGGTAGQSQAASGASVTFGYFGSDY
jgi:hypothetical protein